MCVILSILLRSCRMRLPHAIQALLLALIVPLLLIAVEVLILINVLNCGTPPAIGISLRKLARRHGFLRRLIAAASKFLVSASALTPHLVALLHIEVIRVQRFKLMLLVRQFLRWRLF